MYKIFGSESLKVVDRDAVYFGKWVTTFKEDSVVSTQRVFVICIYFFP